MPDLDMELLDARYDLDVAVDNLDASAACGEGDAVVDRRVQERDRAAARVRQLEAKLTRGRE